MRADIAQRPELYRPLHELSVQVRAHIKVIEELNNYNDVRAVEAALADWPKADGWLPMMARVKPMVVLLNKDSGKVLGVVDLNPW